MNDYIPPTTTFLATDPTPPYRYATCVTCGKTFTEPIGLDLRLHSNGNSETCQSAGEVPGGRVVSK